MEPRYDTNFGIGALDVSGENEMAKKMKHHYAGLGFTVMETDDTGGRTQMRDREERGLAKSRRSHSENLPRTRPLTLECLLEECSTRIAGSFRLSENQPH